MADLPTDFWAGWVAVLTIVSLVGLAWLIWSVYFTPEASDGKADDPVWDETLREGEHPAPMWWFWLIFVLLIFSVLYLILYPGLGSYAGALRWSQGGHFEDRLTAFETAFGGVRRRVEETPLAALRADAPLMASAQRVYDRHCAACHGADAKGQAGHFPDLTDAEWQWGGSARDIEQSVRHGRTAVMVGWLPVLGEAGVAQLADFTMALGRAGTGTADHPGQAAYAQYCAACHGADGGGNPLLGAPSLTDEVSLYGDSMEAIEHSIGVGRTGRMPAFAERLDQTQIRLLVALLTPTTAD